MQVRLSQIISLMRTRDSDGNLPCFVCTQLAELEWVTVHHKQISPVLYQFIKALAPDLIVDTEDMGVMDRWINYDAFLSSTDPQIQEMCQYLNFNVAHRLCYIGNAPAQSYIRADNPFKVKFYTYLLEKHGDLGFEIPTTVTWA